MCLAIPGRVDEINGTEAVIDYGGVKKTASTRLCEQVKVGDEVVVHAGFIIQIMDKSSAEELHRLIDETLDLL